MGLRHTPIYEFAADPDANDDSGDGYEVSDHWKNTSTGEEFVCTVNTVAAAVWKSLTDALNAAGGGDSWFRTFFSYNMVGAAGYTWNGATSVTAGGASILNERHRFLALAGNGTSEEGAYINMILPEDYVAGTNIDVTVYTTSNVAGGNYKVFVGVTQPDGSNQFGTDTETEYLSTVVATSLGWVIQKSTMTFSGTNMSAGDPLAILLFRDAGDAADTEGGDVYFHQIRIEEN